MSERIDIVVTENGTDIVIRKLETVGKSARGSADAVDVLKSALAGLGAAATIRGFTELLDTYQDAVNRLNFVSKSQEEATVTMGKLFEIANHTRQSFENTVDIYARVAFATQSMGTSHADAARVVQTLQEAITLSGASFREANSSLVQFTQGLAAGTLRGRELRSLMQQLPEVADLLAIKLGVTRGALRQMGTEGKVSADIMVQALLDASASIDQKFGNTFPSIGAQLNILKNQLLQFVIELNARFQLIPRIVGFVRLLGDNMDFLGRVVLAGVLVSGVGAAVYALGLLEAALASNAATGLALGIYAAAAAVVAYSDKIEIAKGKTASLADLSSVASKEIGDDFKYLKDVTFDWLNGLEQDFNIVFGSNLSSGLEGALQLFAKFVDQVRGFFNGLKEAIVQAFKNLPASIEAIIANMANAVLQQMENLLNKIIDVTNKMASYVNGPQAPQIKLDRVTIPPQVAQAGRDLASAFKKGFEEGSHDAQDLLGKLIAKAEQVALKRTADVARQAKDASKGRGEFGAPGEVDPNRKDTGQQAAQDIIDKLKDQAAALQGVSIARRTDLEVLRLVNNEVAKGVRLKEEDIGRIREQVAENEQLKIKAKLLESVEGAAEDNAAAQKVLNELIGQGGVYTEQYAAALEKLQIKQLLVQRDLASGFKAGFIGVYEEMTNFATQSAQVVGDLFHGFEDAIVRFVQTGKLSFQDLTNAILADATKIALNQVIVSLIGSIGGALSGLGGAAATGADGIGPPTANSPFAGGSSFGTPIGARADGGPVVAGQTYLVGERGPELFQPPTSGTITPNSQLGGGGGGGKAASGQPIHLKVVNVLDAEELTQHLTSPAGQQVIVNIMRRNRSAVKAALA